jgi:hypothetical protein
MSESIQPLPASRPSPAHREATTAVLCEHFALDHLSMDELERRLELVHRAPDGSALDALIADLPRPASAPTAPAPMVPQPSPAATANVRGEQTMFAMMGGIDKRGRWQPARLTRLVALMGGGTFDFREVELPPGVTELQPICVMGGAEVIVPPGMHVETSGFAIMGGFADYRDSTAGERKVDEPLLRITGFALMGGVDLKTREPGEGRRRRRT